MSESYKKPHQETSPPNIEPKNPKEAAIITWRVAQELESRQKWEKLWPAYIEANNKWVCSGIYRAARKPSQRALEWNAWMRCKPGYSTPLEGECNTRKPFRVDSTIPSSCKPCPWPKTTAGEVGWLAQHPSCNLEVYCTKYNQKPPLPGNHKKFSVEFGSVY